MPKTFGMIVVLAQSTPKTSVNFFRLIVAASRMEKTVSPSHDMQSAPSLSSKNCMPS